MASEELWRIFDNVIFKRFEVSQCKIMDNLVVVVVVVGDSQHCCWDSWSRRLL